MRTKYGDNAAYARLLLAYTPMISSLVKEFSHTCPNVFMSEDDLKQEAAIALYFSALSYKPEKDISFGLYAKICIKNRLLSYMQRSIAKSFSQMISDCIEDCFEESIPDTEQPVNVIISKENCDVLIDEIKKHLSEYEYKVFKMYADGEKPASIAEKLGKSPKSVYNTLQRAREKLKKSV